MALRPARLSAVVLLAAALLAALVVPSSPVGAQAAADDIVVELDRTSFDTKGQVALGSDGRLRSVTVDRRSKIVFSLCSDRVCSSSTETTLRPDSVSGVSMVLDAADRPVFAFAFGNSKAGVLRCSQIDCIDRPRPMTITAPGVTLLVLDSPVVALSDDAPIVLTTYMEDRDDGYMQTAGYALFRCEQRGCGGDLSVATFPSSYAHPADVHFGLSSSGLPVFTMNRGRSGEGEPILVRCADVRCVASSQTQLGFADQVAVMVLDSADRPAFLFDRQRDEPVYRKMGTWLVRCNTPSCSSRKKAQRVDRATRAKSMVLASDDTPLIALEGAEFSDVHLVDCATPDCSSNPVLRRVDTVGYVNAPTVLLDADENPTLVYQARRTTGKDWSQRVLRTCVDGCDDEPPFPDRCRLLENPNIIIGTEGDDRLNGTPGVDVIIGLGGDDLIRGRGGNDCISPGLGRNTVLAGGGDDAVFGFSPRFQRINGGSGDDVLVLNDQSNGVLRGGSGSDTMLGSPEVSYRGGPGTDTCMSIFVPTSRARSCEHQPEDIGEIIDIINAALDDLLG